MKVVKSTTYSTYSSHDTSIHCKYHSVVKNTSQLYLGMDYNKKMNNLQQKYLQSVQFRIDLTKILRYSGAKIISYP